MKTFKELFINRKDGSLSSTKVFGVLIMLISAVIFCFSALKYQNPEMMSQSMYFGALGATLLGIKNVYAPK